MRRAGAGVCGAAAGGGVELTGVRGFPGLKIETWGTRGWQRSRTGSVDGTGFCFNRLRRDQSNILPYGLFHLFAIFRKAAEPLALMNSSDS